MADNNENTNGSSLYRQLQERSLKAASMEHGLQYNSIYWEAGHRTWLTFFQPICHKFTWKIIDDTFRQLLRFTNPISHCRVAFYDEEFRMRYSHGDADLQTVVSLTKTPVFSFHPLASYDPFSS